MSRHVYVGGKRYSVDPSQPTFIAKGGEAEVYRFGNRQALKVFHRIDPADPPDKQRAKRNALRLKGQKIREFPTGLPSEVLAPIDLATTRSGEVIGYTMPFLKGFSAFHKLSDRRFRDSAGLGQDATHQLLLRLYAVLTGVHAAGVVVGDLNDGNEMYRVKPSPDVRLIDVDSMQFGRYPCTVAAQRFLDPKLYGRELGRGQFFTTETDWYAFACLSLQSLLCVLPFGGMHKKLRTYLRRAEAGICVFNDAVRYPGGGFQKDVLPDDLLQHFTQVFEQGLRGVFPERVLQFRWTTCSQCSLEHARPRCPGCSAPGLVVEAIQYNKKCRATRVFTCPGFIREIKEEHGRLRVVYETTGAVRREDHTKVWDSKPPPHTRTAIAGDSTWIGSSNGVLLQIAKHALQSRATTGIMGNLPVFGATRRYLYTLEGGHLKRTDAQGRWRILGSIIPGSTWFKVGEGFGGFAFYKAGHKWFFYVFRDHLLPVQGIPSPQGKVREVDCVFSDQHALFLLSEDRQGVIVNSMWLVDAKGNVVGHAEGEADQVRMLSTISGKLVSSGKTPRIVCSTDEGLLQLVVNDAGGIEESKLFTDTRPFVRAGDRLLQAPTGIWVADRSTVRLLELG